MNVDSLLAKLEGVRSNGRGRWMARCPSHEDRLPSLSVRELDDGRILLHCFGGCDVESVLGALGLEFDSLFPEKPQEYVKGERRPWPAVDVLRALVDESMIVAVAAANLAQHVELTDADRERLMLAAERINAGRTLALGR